MSAATGLAEIPQAAMLPVPSAPQIDLWIKTGMIVAKQHDSYQWRIGDWLNEGQILFGEKNAYVEAEAITGKKRQTLYQLSSVANRVAVCMRHTKLTWEHHQIVAALEPEEQKRWLDLAERKQLKAKELRTKIRADNPRKKKDARPEWVRLVVPMRIEEYRSLRALAAHRGTEPIFRKGEEIESAGAAILVRQIACEHLEANAEEVETACRRAARKALGLKSSGTHDQQERVSE